MYLDIYHILPKWCYQQEISFSALINMTHYLSMVDEKCRFWQNKLSLRGKNLKHPGLKAVHLSFLSYLVTGSFWKWAWLCICLDQTVEKYARYSVCPYRIGWPSVKSLTTWWINKNHLPMLQICNIFRSLNLTDESIMMHAFSPLAQNSTLECDPHIYRYSIVMRMFFH